SFGRQARISFLASRFLPRQAGSFLATRNPQPVTRNSHMKIPLLSCAILLSTLAASAQDKQREASFDSFLSSESIGKTIEELSAKPHYIGTPGSKEVAENILAKFKSYGWDAEIETYTVLFPEPRVRVLEMTSPKKFTALLKEPGFKEDRTSGQAGQLPVS